MSKKTPFQKIKEFLKKTYELDEREEIRLSKSKMEEHLFESVGTSLPLVRNAKNLLIEDGLLIWPSNRSHCVINLTALKVSK